MKIYTKTGDDGTTGLLGPGRFTKHSPRIDAYGIVDELNAAVGFARALGVAPALDASLALVQDDLFVVGAALADPDPSGRFHGAVGDERASRLEREIDEMEASLPELAHFILPGGSPGASAVHLARAVCRRAERAVVGLRDVPGEDVPHAVIVYMNRLSDFLFVLARAANAAAGREDAIWKGL